MTAKSETPLTNAAALGFARIIVDHEKRTTTELVDANFARRMERDRARLIECLREFANSACDDEGVLDSHPIEDCTELTEGHLRKARALLRELEEEK